MTDQDILAQIKALLAGAPVEVPPWEIPELPPSAIPLELCDGVTVHADGSTWDKWDSPLWVPNSEGKTVKIGKIYGYISKAKVGPALWERMCQYTSGGEARLQEILTSNGPTARYKMHPAAAVFQGDNSTFLLSYLLSNPIGN